MVRKSPLFPIPKCLVFPHGMVLTTMRTIQAGLSIANTIPIFYAAAAETEDPLKTATDRAVALVADTIAGVDDLTDKLMARYGSKDPNDQLTKDLKNLIDGCKSWCTGNLYWRYACVDIPFHGPAIHRRMLICGF